MNNAPTPKPTAPPTLYNIVNTERGQITHRALPHANAMQALRVAGFGTHKLVRRST